MSDSSIKVSVLGATGSIGLSTLDVIERQQQRFSLFAITANTRVDEMFKLVLRHQPKYAVMSCTDSAKRLTDLLASERCGTEVLAGKQALIDVSAAEEVDYVMAAIVGAAGLMPTLAAVKAGKRVLLANKEALVMTGELFMCAVRESGAELLPIDSEHNAIYQCYPVRSDQSRPAAGVKRILLTASGGPFRNSSLDELRDVTPAQACAHPNWSMGAKISVDSATMMNKGLELIEACWLFATPQQQVDILIHPQSIIHSLVEYDDGSMLAQLGNPDMRTPIAYGLGWPERIDSGVRSLDLVEIGRLEFQEVDRDRFPCVRLAELAMTEGGSASAILNAANEVAVAAFLAEKLPFTGIATVVDEVLQRQENLAISSVEEVLEIDAQARELAQQLVTGRDNVQVLTT